MPDEYYTLLAGGMRYWFLLLMLVIVLRCIRWYHADRRSFILKLKRLPTADSVGNLVVVYCSDIEEVGRSYRVPIEGTLGRYQSDDICIKQKYIGNVRLQFHYVEGSGLLVETENFRNVWVDRILMNERSACLMDQSVLSVEGIALRMQFYEVLHCPLSPMAAAEAQVYEEASADDPHQPKPFFTEEDYAPLLQPGKGGRRR